MENVMKYHDNYDAVLKYMLSLYTDKSLEFLGIKGRVTELLNAENIEIDIRKTLDDQVLRLDNQNGVDIEWEANISKDDLLRFASYNIALTRKYKIPFETIIMTRKKVEKKSYISRSIKFTPRVINLNARNGKAALKGIRDKLDKGAEINPLEVVYLPLYNNSGMTFKDVYKEIIGLLPKMAIDKREQERLLILSVLLANKFIEDDDEYKTILGMIKMAFEGNRMIKILEENGAIEKAREIVKGLLEFGVSIDIIKKTCGLSEDEILEIQQGLVQTANN